MTQKQDLWGLMTVAQGAIVQNFGSKIQEAVQNSILNEVQGWGNLGLAMAIKPDPLTVERMATRNPYGSEARMQSNVDALKEANMLDANGVITDEANSAYMTLVDTQNNAIGELEVDNNVEQAATFIKRVFDAAINLDEPDNTNIKEASTRDLGDTAIHDLFYLTARLNAFRDDCHIAAWRKHDIDGRMLEALTILWSESEETKTATAMAEGRPYRGWEESDWKTSLDALLDALVKKGWATQDGDEYIITDDGKSVRDAIEKQTNEYFYAAFDVLNDKQVDTFADSLKAIEEHFTPEPEAQ